LKITVLILTYNRKLELDRCLKSVRASSIKPSEILVIDNASSMDISNIIEKHDVKYIRLHKNFGCPTGRNIGLTNCKNELVYMLDDDGWLDEFALEKVLKTYKQLLYNGIKVGAIKSHVHLTKKSNVVGKEVEVQGEFLQQKRNFSGGASLLVKKAFIDSGGYPDDFWGYGEEVDLSLRMLDRGYEIFEEPGSIMYHEPMLGGNRIDKKYIFYISRNVITSVARNFPYYLVVPAIIWYSVRWNMVAFKSKALHYSLAGVFISIIKNLKYLFKFRNRLKTSTIKKYLKIKN
jgi:GT2 family glycosyltransferase